MFSKVRRWRVKRRRKISEATALRIRFGLFRGLTIFVFIVLLGQLWRMQIIEGSRYQRQAENNRLRMLTVAPKRGVVYDRDGTLLVRNLPSFTVAVVPADLPLDKQPSVATRLGAILKTPADDIVKAIDKRRADGHIFAPLAIKTQVEQEAAFTVEEYRSELPGVSLLVEASRRYLGGPITSHLLGYTGRISAEEYERLQDDGYELNDTLGKAGLEYTYEEYLRGVPGVEQVEVNVAGRKVRSLYTRPPEPGANLVLNIDIDLQREMTKILKESMGKMPRAVAIAGNPQTGEILGLVSLPSYDNNLFSTGISDKELAALLNDPARPLIDYALSGIYPPGSIFKLITGSAALQEGIATPSTRIFSAGALTLRGQYGSVTFRDWSALGWLDFRRAIAKSSDVYFYYLSGGYENFKGLGPDRLARHARSFGLGQTLGIDLPGEVEGIVPDTAWKRTTAKEDWYLGDTYSFGIGQGYLSVTPLQMWSMVSTVANGGTVYQPQIVHQVVDVNGKVVVPFAPRVIRKVDVSPQNIQIVREGMKQAATGDGTAVPAAKAIPGIPMAGKTGTAEFGVKDRSGNYQTHGWFVSFAPYDNPEIAVVVFHEQGAGYDTAAPTAGKILAYYFSKKPGASPTPTPAKN